MVIILLLVFVLPVILGLLAWYIISSIVAYRYVKACGGSNAWIVWLPLSIRSMAICGASDKVHPLNVPDWLYLVLGVGTLTGLALWAIPFSGWIVMTCSTLLFIFTCIYVYTIANDLGKSALLYLILYILFSGLAEPFILHAYKKEINKII